MPRRTVLVVLLAFLVAGCAKPADAPAAPGPEGTAALSQSISVDRPAGTAFHWALRSPRPALAVEFVWDFGPGNECQVLQATSSGPTPGPDDLSLFEAGGSVLGWGSGASGGGLASAHAGPVDSRPGSDASDRGAHFDRSGTISLQGAVRFTWLLANAQAGDTEYVTDADVSAAVSVTCAHSFELLAANEGSIGLLLSDQNFAGGAGYSAFGGGSAGVGDSAQAQVFSPLVRFASASFGRSAARVTVETPAGDHEWLHQPTDPAVVEENLFLAEDGPGSYKVTVDQAGIQFQTLWVAVWGVDGPLDLTGTLSSSTVIVDPFEDS